VTDIKEVLNSFNNVTPNLNFTLEMEQDNKLYFLDLPKSKAAGKILLQHM
jgi:hypothetical protein